jgi:hypothetical protein
MAKAEPIERGVLEFDPRWKVWVAPLMAAATTVLSGFLLFDYRRRVLAARRERPAPVLPPGMAGALPDIQGLTQEEAEARRTDDLVVARERAALRARRAVWRNTILNIFNLNIAVLMVFQLLLQDPVGAGLTFLVLCLSTGSRLILQNVALRQVEGIVEQTRPTVAAIRDGEPRTLDLDQIVVGDVLLVGPGDGLVAQGRVLAGGDLVVDRTTASGERRRMGASKGEVLPPASYCVEGWAAYEVLALPSEESYTASMTEMTVTKEHRTSMQNIVNRILQVMVVVVIVLLVILLASLRSWDDELTDEVLRVYRSNIGRVLSLAPGSLFLGIAVSMAVGSALVARLGALVRHPRFVESLAQMKTLFLGRASVWARTDLEIEMLPLSPEEKGLPLERVRQVLGTYARSTRADDAILRSIRRAVAGDRRTVSQEATFLTSLGWRGITFSEPDIEGTYVLGLPELFESQFFKPVEEEPGDEDEQQRPGLWNRMRGGLGRLARGSAAQVEDLRESNPVTRSLWKRLKGRNADISEGTLPAEPPAEQTSMPVESVPAEPTPTPTEETLHTAAESTSEAVAAPSEDEALLEGQVLAGDQRATGGEAIPAEQPGEEVDSHSFRRRLQAIWRRSPSQPEPEPEPEPEPDNRLALVLAYSPIPQPLFGANAVPQLPAGVTPICTLRFDEQSHPESADVLRAAVADNIQIKLFASEVPEWALAAVQMLRAETGVEAPPRARPGVELAAMDESELARTVRREAIFAPLSAEQRAHLVRALRQTGEEVAMVGDDMEDVPAMRQAHTSIAFRTSGRAVLGSAGIMLLHETPRVLLDVVGRARLSINSLLNSLKLNLTQISYVFVLQLIVMGLRRADFFYHSSHGGVIAVVAVVLPGLVLPFWSAMKLVPRASLVPRLMRFVLPAGLTRATAVMVLDYLMAQRGSETLNSQNAVMLATIAIGLILFVWLQPPVPRPTAQDDPLASLRTADRLRPPARPLFGRDRRFVFVALGLAVAFAAFMSIPLMQRLLSLRFLSSPQDYLVVALVVLVWAGVLRLLWLIPALNPYR